MIEHTSSSMGPRPPTGGMKLALEEAVTAHEEEGVLARLLPPFPLKGDRGDRLGLGLNDSNQVTVVLPGSWAAAQGVLRRDKIVQANTEALVGGQQLADALADLRERDVDMAHLVLVRNVAAEAPPLPSGGKTGGNARAVGSPSRRRRKEPEPQEPEEPPGPTDSQRRRNAVRVSDLLLELDDEKDEIGRLYDAAHKALAEWAAEFTAIRQRDPTSAEVRESPVWPFVKTKTVEAEVRRGALNQTLATMGEEPMAQPTAARDRRGAGQGGSTAPPPPQQQEAYGGFNGERARLTLLRALEPNVLQPPEATAELRAYFCTVALAVQSAGAAGVDNAFVGTDDVELEQAALLFAHFDADGDGLLSRDEFVALLGLVAAKAGHAYSHEHLAAMFTEADLDCNEVLDLNELLLLLRGDAVRLPGGAG